VSPNNIRMDRPRLMVSFRRVPAPW